MTLSFRKSALVIALLGGATLLSAPAMAGSLYDDDYVADEYAYESGYGYAPPPAYVVPAYPEPLYAPPPYAAPVVVAPEVAVAPPPPPYDYEYAPEPFIVPGGAVAVGID
jgi:hypothetical protein